MLLSSMSSRRRLALCSICTISAIATVLSSGTLKWIITFSFIYMSDRALNHGGKKPGSLRASKRPESISQRPSDCWDTLDLVAARCSLAAVRCSVAALRLSGFFPPWPEYKNFLPCIMHNAYSILPFELFRFEVPQSGSKWFNNPWMSHFQFLYFLLESYFMSFSTKKLQTLGEKKSSHVVGPQYA